MPSPTATSTGGTPSPTRSRSSRPTSTGAGSTCSRRTPANTPATSPARACWRSPRRSTACAACGPGRCGSGPAADAPPVGAGERGVGNRATPTVEQPPLPGVETRRRLRADDLFSLTFVGDVAISPDGNTICFVQTRMDRQENEYRSDLWIVPAAGMPGEALQYTHVPRTVAQPRWAPNGRWLAFLTDRESKGKRQLWIIPTAGVGGEARQLTSGETSVSDYAWAPDSTRLVFVRPETIDRRQGRDTADTGE